MFVSLRSLSAPLWLSCLVVSQACSDDSYEVELAVVETVVNPFAIEAPADARSGEPFEVVLTTYGGSCTSVEETEVTAQADTASITPYNRVRVGSNCPKNIEFVLHRARLMFDTPGSKTIVVYGKKDPGGASGVLTDVSHTVQVTVQ